jgi:hypothetical protein
MLPRHADLTIRKGLASGRAQMEAEGVEITDAQKGRRNRIGRASPAKASITKLDVFQI